MSNDTSLTGPDVAELEDLASQARAHILRAIHNAQGGHVGGPLSVIDMLTALYQRILNIRPDEPDWPDRDRLVLSKGHSAIAIYTALAMRGYFPTDELFTFDAINSRMQGHPDMAITPGIDMSSGSLGLGFSGGVGIAMGAKAAGKDFMTYIILGDGECNEGVVWEGAHVVERYGLDNIVAIVDHNKLQQFGWRGETVAERLPSYTGTQLLDRWSAFGWKTLEMDGHDMADILAKVADAKAADGPVAIIAHTIKGKGVSFMEGDYRWHAKAPNDEELELALRELGQLDEGGAA